MSRKLIVRAIFVVSAIIFYMVLAPKTTLESIGVAGLAMLASYMVVRLFNL